MAMYQQGYEVGLDEDLRRTSREIKAYPFYKKVFVLLGTFCLVSSLLFIVSRDNFMSREKPFGSIDGLILLVGFGVFMVLTAFWLGHDIVYSLCACRHR